MVHSAVVIISNAFYKYLDIDPDTVIADYNATVTCKSIFISFFFPFSFLIHQRMYFHFEFVDCYRSPILRLF